MWLGGLGDLSALVKTKASLPVALIAVARKSGQVGSGTVRMEETMESARGTILQLTRLTESSLIVHWLTPSHGLIKTVARGARRGGSSHAGRLDLFLEAEIEWVPTRSKESDLNALREVQVLDFRMELRKNYRNSLMAGYFCRLLEMTLEPGSGELEVHDLLQRALRWLVEKSPTLRGMRHFESQLSELLGLGTGGAPALLQAYGKLPTTRDQCLDLLK